MKVFSTVKRSFRKIIISSVVAGAMLGVGLASTATAAAAGANCDANAVVYCGVTSASNADSKYLNGVSGHNSASSIQDIYHWFGISKSDMANFHNEDQTGYVTKSGNVYTGGTLKNGVYSGGTLVATNALTGGRENIPGSHIRTDGGTTFYSRPPSVSFLENTLGAVVDMKNGVFQFAVLNSCGNPVKATPEKPNYNVNKLVRVKGTSAYSNSVTVKSGTHVQYQITVSSTGKVPVLNTVVHDALPAHIQYVNNTLKRDGNTVSSDTAFFAKGITIAKLNNGDKTVFTFEAIVGPTDTPEKCVPESLNNEAYIDSPSLPPVGNGAGVKKECLPKPVYQCTSLTAVATKDPMTYTFNGKATAANGAKITGYTFDFGDGTSKTVASTSPTGSLNHTYTKDGTYTAVLTAIFNVDGTTKKVTSTDCKAKVTVKKPVVPVYACDSLTADQISRNEFTFNGKASASNGATITGYIFDFGDGKSTTVASSSPTGSLNHTYAKDGDYTATLTALISVKGKVQNVTSEGCTTKVTVQSKPVAKCTGLTATPGENRSVSVTVTYQAANGAALKAISYNFGDNTDPQVTTDTTVAHTYAADGSYTIIATLSFTGGSENVPDSTCQAPVTFNTVAPSCNNLTVDVDNDSKTVTVKSLTYTANNGTYTVTTLNWGDNSALVSSTDISGQSHQYAANGPFTIVATVHFTVNGTDTPVTSSSCQKVVSFSQTPPPVTPPTTLVNTGAGSTIGLFAGISALGAIGYHFVLRRRLNRG